ncbi:MAG: biopolymer transporter ExbD [Pirellulales bacterium]|nr:biopolymer transporter ExbD [Pirellulales bacterium]
MSINDAGNESPLMPERKIEDAEMDITPMIDITFLLLIFFLVASKMDSPASGELPTAVANRPIMADKAIVLNIEKNGDGIKVTSPQQWNQPAKEFSGDMDTLIGEVTEYVGRIVAADEEKQVLLQASG